MAAAATTGRQRGGDLDADANEQLPKYEAAPPMYDTLYKDGPPPTMAQGTMSDLGSSSSAAVLPPPPLPAHTALLHPQSQSQSGEVVINVEPPSQPGSMPPPPPAQEDGNVAGRAWARLTGGLNRQ